MSISSSFSHPPFVVLSSPATPIDKPAIGFSRLPISSPPRLLDDNSSAGRTTTRRHLLRTVTASVAASAAFPFTSVPAKAGFLSGSTGIESIPGPELPSIEFLNRWNDENQKLYSESDARFKDSPILKKLLEKSKLNKEKNKQELLDKYCLRGAEWGVGDCSAEGMTLEERDKFIAMLKQKVGGGGGGGGEKE